MEVLDQMQRAKHGDVALDRIRTPLELTRKITEASSIRSHWFLGGKKTRRGEEKAEERSSLLAK
jgi:hypothetical protein